MAKNNLARIVAAIESNLDAARRVMDLWDECDGLQREWARLVIPKYGSREDCERLKGLETGVA